MENRMMSTLALLFFASAILGFAQAANCDGTFNETVGSLDLSSVEPGKTCTWTAFGNSSTVKALSIQLTNIVIAEGATLDIYDGDASGTKLLSVNGSSVASQVLAILTNKTTIVFTGKPSGTERSNGTIHYNRLECAATFTNNMALGVSSPVFMTNQSDLSCTYLVSNAKLPLDRTAVVAFAQFSLEAKSSLKLTSGAITTTYSGFSMSPQPDFFSDQEDGDVKIEMLFTKSTKAQSFSLVFDAFVKACSGDQILQDDSTIISISPELPSAPSVAYACRMRLKNNSTGPAILATVSELSLTRQDAATFTLGASSLGKNVAELSQAVPPTYMLLASDPAIVMTLTLGSTVGDRKFNVSFQGQAAGGRFQGSGTLQAGKVKEQVPEASADLTLTAYYQLVADQGNQVSLNLLTPLAGNATLTLYRGLQKSDGVLTTLDANSVSQGLNTLVGGPEMLVVLKDFPVKENFTATFSSVKQGCNEFTSESSGQLVYTMSSDNDTTKCVWVIAPSAKGVIVLAFDSMNLGANESVAITTDKSAEIASFTGPLLEEPFPEINIPSETPARVSISRTSTYRKETRIVLNYKLVPQVCGGELGANGQIMTPNYPNQYPLNAACLWKPVMNDATMLYLRFDSLDLVQNHSIAVAHQDGKTVTTVASYSGSATTMDQLPGDLLVKADNTTFVSFTSRSEAGEVSNKVGTGALLEYKVLTCGGNLTTLKDSITNPSYPAQSTDKFCMWMVQLPPTGNSTHRSLQFTLEVNSTEAGLDVDKHLFIYDGPNTRYPVISGDGVNGTFLSRYRNLTVVLDLEKAGNVSMAFNLSYTTYLCKNATDTQCANGICMQPGWRCDGVNDCGDNSDEIGCKYPPTPSPKPVPAQDYSGWVKAGWIPGCLFIGLLIGAALFFIVPRVIKRVRGGGSPNYNRMNDGIA